VPATEVARRAGHGVAVLLKIYAHCIDGQADAANKRITDALGTQDTQPEPEPRRRGRRRQCAGVLKCQVRGTKPDGGGITAPTACGCWKSCHLMRPANIHGSDHDCRGTST
jgi:hypothetical protein